MGEAVIDARGRIVIPNEVRTRLRLRPEQKLRVSARGQEIILTPEVDTEAFVSRLKGCVKKSKVKPGELKSIWGVDHPHD